MSTIGSIVVGIVGDIRDLTAKLKASSEDIGKFGESLKKSGENVATVGKEMTKWVTGPLVAAGAGLLALTVKAGNFSDELLDATEKTGLSTDTLQEFRYVCVQAGSAADAIQIAVQGLIRRLPSLAEEGSVSSEQMAKLGVTFADLKAMSPEEIVNTLIGRLSAMEDPLERNAIAAKLFGLNWTEIAPILGLGADEIARLREEAHDLGIVIGRDALEQGDKFRQGWVKIKAELNAVFMKLGIDLGPTIQSILKTLTDKGVPILKDLAAKLKALFDWFDDLSKPMQDFLLWGGLAVIAIGPVLLVLGNLVKSIGTVIAALNSLMMSSFLTNPIFLGLAALTVAVGLTAASFVVFKTRAEEAKKAAAELGDYLLTVGDNVGKARMAVEAALAGLIVSLREELIASGEMALAEFDRSILAPLAVLTSQVTKLPVEEMAPAWAEGITAILGEVAKLNPAVQTILDKAVAVATTTKKETKDSATEIGKDLAGIGTAGEDAFSSVGTAAKDAAKTAKKAAEDTLADWQATFRALSAGWVGTYQNLESAFAGAEQAIRDARAAEADGLKVDEALNAAAKMLQDAYSQAITEQGNLFSSTGKLNDRLLSWIAYAEVFARQYKIVLPEATKNWEKSLQGMYNVWQGTGVPMFLDWDESARRSARLAQENYNIWQGTGVDIFAPLNKSLVENWQATEDWYNVWQGTGVTLRIVPLWIQDIATALSDLAQGMQTTVAQRIGGFFSAVQTAFSTFFDGLSDMVTGNEKLLEDHKATLDKIAEAQGKAVDVAAKTRAKDHQNLVDALTDGKITREQFAREHIQLERDYSDAVAAAAEERETAIGKETAAYAEQKKTLGDILGDMLHNFLRAAREELTLQAAKHTATAIAKSFLAAFNPLLWPDVASEWGAAAAYSAGAGGLALTGFKSGGIVAGALGEPMPAIVHGGEQILTPEERINLGIDYARMGEAVAAGVYDALAELQGRGSGTQIILEVDGNRLARAVYPGLLYEAQRRGTVIVPA